MPDNLTQLQQAVEQRRLERRGSALPHWLILLDRLRRLTMTLGILIILGVIGSIAWPYIRKTQQERTKPPQVSSGGSKPAVQTSTKPMASQPAVAVPASQAAAVARAKGPVPAATTTNEPPLDAIETHKPGQTFTIGTWEYRVTGRQWRDPTAAESPAAPGRKSLTVTVLVRNISHETALLPAPQLAGLGDTRYDPCAIASSNTAVGQPIGPGTQQTRQFTFKVPAAEHYKLLLPAGWLSDKYAGVEINP